MTKINEGAIDTFMTTEADAWPLIPEEVSREIVDGIAEGAVTLRQFRRLPNMARRLYRMPVLDSLGRAEFVSATVDDDLAVGEDDEHNEVPAGVPNETYPGYKQTHQMEWKNVYIVAEEIAIILPIPEAVIADASYDLWAEMRPRIVEAFGATIDDAVVFGQGRPATWPSGIVPTAIARGFSVAEGAGADLAEDVSDLMATIEAVGFDPTGFFGDVSVKSRLRGLRDLNGGLLFQPSLQAGTPSTLYGLPMDYVKNGAWRVANAHMVTGDMSKAVYSIRQDMTWKLFTEGVITDSDGSVIVNLMQQDMVAMRVVLRMGWAVPNPITALQPNRALRYPFAVLTA